MGERCKLGPVDESRKKPRDNHDHFVRWQSRAKVTVSVMNDFASQIHAFLLDMEFYSSWCKAQGDVVQHRPPHRRTKAKQTKTTCT